jgi:hypothetical protein
MKTAATDIRIEPTLNLGRSSDALAQALRDWSAASCSPWFG